MKPTSADLVRWAGLPATAAGILFIVIQIIHPSDALSSVTTGRWVIVHSLGVAMSLFALVGITGIYASHTRARDAGARVCAGLAGDRQWFRQRG